MSDELAGKILKWLLLPVWLPLLACLICVGAVLIAGMVAALLVYVPIRALAPSNVLKGWPTVSDVMNSSW